MGYENKVECITLIAGADLSSGKQYKFMDLASDGQIDPVGTAGAKAVGVLQNKPAAAGRAATVAVGGVTKIELAATLNAGAEVMSNTAGEAIAVTATSRSHGTILEGGVDGDIVPMLLHLNSYASAT